MSPRISVVVVAVPLAGVLALSGCAGSGASTAAGVHESAPPRWVRIVPVSTPETWYYVGAAIAPDAEAALEEARRDAFGQAAETARRRFRDLLDLAIRESEIETTSRERLSLRTEGGDDFAARLAGIVSMEETYVGPCGDSGCRAFVLVSVGRTAGDRLLAETVHWLRRKESVASEERLVRLTDWMLRILG